MTRPTTIIGCRTDAEILADFARALALKELLDDMHAAATQTGTAPTRTRDGASDPTTAMDTAGGSAAPTLVARVVESRRPA